MYKTTPLEGFADEVGQCLFENLQDGIYAWAEDIPHVSAEFPENAPAVMHCDCHRWIMQLARLHLQKLTLRLRASNQAALADPIERSFDACTALARRIDEFCGKCEPVRRNDDYVIIVLDFGWLTTNAVLEAVGEPIGESDLGTIPEFFETVQEAKVALAEIVGWPSNTGSTPDAGANTGQQGTPAGTPIDLSAYRPAFELLRQHGEQFQTYKRFKGFVDKHHVPTRSRGRRLWVHAAGLSEALANENKQAFDALDIDPKVADAILETEKRKQAIHSRKEKRKGK